MGITLTIGLPGSGKSYWARKQFSMFCDGLLPGVGLRIIERDLLREELTGSRRDFTREADVTRLAFSRADMALVDGWDIIVSDTNLKPRYRRDWQALAECFGVEYHEVSFLHVPIEACIARDAERSDPVGEDVIRKMHQYLLDSGQISR